MPTPRPFDFDFIYLASQSPRRATLLDQLGASHRLLAPDEGEDVEAIEAERPGELPLAYVQRVTRAKLAVARARLARRGLPPAPILCADTTVALGRRILGKPIDAAHAADMLHALGGRTHRVLTAVALAVPSGARSRTLAAVSVSRVHVAPLSAHNVSRYVASGEPRGKAGAYAVQGRMAAFITRIEGSYTGIMGLPLHETTTLLMRARVHLDL